jgi:hypothetical protein
MSTTLESIIAEGYSHDGFLGLMIRLDQAQLIAALEEMGEDYVDEESRAGKDFASRCMEAVRAVGRFKFPDTWDEAVRLHFQGDASAEDQFESYADGMTDLERDDH